jgi:hypothetical protein
LFYASLAPTPRNCPYSAFNVIWKLDIPHIHVKTLPYAKPAAAPITLENVKPTLKQIDA